MAELSELLELVYGREERWRSLHAVVRTWQDTALLEQALEREADRDEDEWGSSSVIGFSIYVPSSHESEDDPAASVVRLWLERPNRSREETEGPFPHTTASDGECRWVTHGEAGVVEMPVDDEDGIESWFLSPNGVTAIEPRELADVERLGRRAIRIRGPLRSKPWPRLPMEGDETELVVDAERGVLLAKTSFFEGAPLMTTEVLEIAFDEPIDPALFRLEPGPGQKLMRAEDMDDDAFAADLTLEEAAARSSFALWIPLALPALDPETRPWEGWSPPSVTHMPAGGWNAVESVSIHFHAEVGDITLHENAATEPLVPGDGWEEIDRNGRRLHVDEPGAGRSRRFRPLMILIELEGTLVQVTSQRLDRETLIDLAATLARVSDEPPSLDG